MKNPIPGSSGWKKRKKIAQAEIVPLSRLVKAMFDDISTEVNNADISFAHSFDHLDPDIDGSLNETPWVFGVEGDFYFVHRAVSGHLFIVFGDATGHFDYAGGLKLFVARALKHVLDKSSEKKVVLNAKELATEIYGEFTRVGRAALKEGAGEALEDGANLIVLRISSKERTADYAAAGIPVRTINSHGKCVCYGQMHDRPKTLAFPNAEDGREIFNPDVGSFRLDEIKFLLFLTDGFERLGRLRRKRSSRRSVVRMGAEGVDVSIAKIFDRLQGKSVSARDLVDAMIERARRWRKGYFIPEYADDDRLVLVVDVQSVLSESEYEA